jgi:hypothetical protein
LRPLGFGSTQTGRPPSVSDVALLLRTRTIGAGGGDLDTFTADTHPNAAAVEALIDEALGAVLAQLPDHMDPAFYPAVQRLVALRAAASVEISFYREAESAGEWTSRFAVDLAALQQAIPGATLIA